MDWHKMPRFREMDQEAFPGQAEQLRGGGAGAHSRGGKDKRDGWIRRTAFRNGWQRYCKIVEMAGAILYLLAEIHVERGMADLCTDMCRHGDDHFSGSRGDRSFLSAGISVDRRISDESGRATLLWRTGLRGIRHADQKKEERRR